MLVRMKKIFSEKNKKVAAMSALFFMTTAIFWILKPIKKGVFISHYKANVFDFWQINLGGAQTEQIAKLTIVVIALLFAFLMVGATRWFSMQRIFIAVCVLVIAGTIFFGKNLSNNDNYTVWSFYLFGDLQYSLVIALLWSVLHNTFRLDEAKYVFTFIGLSGLLGGLGGTFLVQQAIDTWGRENLVLLCVIPLIVILWLGSKFLCRKLHPDKTSILKNSSPCEGFSNPKSGEKSSELSWQDFGKSKYWIAIALIVGLYEMTSGIIDIQLSLTVENMNISSTERSRYFGFVGVAQNLVALLVQIFFTGYIIRNWGLKTALMILPFTILLGSVGFFFIPSLAGAMFLVVSDNGLNYSLNQQAKETLYVPTKPQERIRAKAFIDLFVQRFAKAAAVVLNLIIVSTTGLEAARWLSLPAIVLLLAWIFIINLTGREFDSLTELSPENR